MVQIYKWHFIGLAIFSFLSFVAVVPAQSGTLGEPNESYVDDILKRWMANYLAISEFECRFSKYATVRDARDMAELRKSHAQKDQRGYYILSRFDFKYRPHDRFYRADGFIQSPGEGGKRQTTMYLSDGSDHRTFSEENYSGIIEPEERTDFHLFQNPNHYLNFDSDLASVYRAGGIVRESELIYTAKVPARFFPVPGRPPSQHMDTLRFHLSPNHGYMPQKIEVIAENGNLKYIHEVLDFAQLDGIWFPVRGTRSVNLKKNAEQMDYVDLLEIEPGSLKINPGLDRQVYRFEYPAGSAFINNATGEKVIGDEYRRRERLASEAYQAKMRAQTSGPWVWVTLGVALALLLGWSVYRKFGAGALL